MVLNNTNALNAIRDIIQTFLLDSAYNVKLNVINVGNIQIVIILQTISNYKWQH
jgi:hypothetical protein